MDNLHAPTVAATTNGSSNGVPASQLNFQQLLAEKDRLESELSALSAVLDSHGVNMNTGLTTFDGYPRADLDIAQIRTTRARIIHLKNDYKALLDALEKQVHARFAEAAAQPATVQSQAEPSIPQPMEDTSTPFAQVNGVSPGSPAEAAGLRVGDKITRFGTANWLNHDKLAKIPEVVAQNEGRAVAVTLLRETSDGTTERVSLIVTPRPNWGGRGMLGCHLLPL
ncbi:26S proteasome non-ATPase-like protein regulatory subunit 9 [Trichodelitschia bisporula]|uniref:Probable 26S proteasome regulatory subunit p27 n=1 Tax=Trichodelitschia bisporula TaxID=703511 RepID=A0A6G1I185_9PEZI|nr:26S proteasome non-ATPase-like protein regulatory subunit 9 [Trichodelitschia bisporula]